MQDLVSRGDLQIRKVHATENCANPFTKYLDTETLKSHLGIGYVLKLFYVVLICNLELQALFHQDTAETHFGRLSFSKLRPQILDISTSGT